MGKTHGLFACRGHCRLGFLHLQVQPYTFQAGDYGEEGHRCSCGPQPERKTLPAPPVSKQNHKNKFIKMKTLLLFAFLSCCGAIVAQDALPSGTVTVISPDSLKFTLFINSVRQNQPPEFCVVATGISARSIPVTVSFQRTDLPTVSALLERNTTNAAFNVMRNEKGRIVIVPRVEACECAAKTLPNSNAVIAPSPVTPVAGSTNNTKPAANSLDVRTNQDGKLTDVKSSTAGEFHDDGNTQSYRSANGKMSVSSNVRIVPKTELLPGPLPTAEELHQIPVSPSGPAAQKGLPPGTFTFYSNDGYPFILFMQGIQINATPMTNVVVQNVVDGNLQVRLEFQDPKIPTIKKSFMRMGRDCGYAVERDSKGFLVLRLRSNVGDLSNH